MLPEEVRDRIDFEFEEIESLFELYKKEIFEMAQKPDLFEMTALAGILHSFYNGMEKILLIIAHGVDKKIPTDTKWHKSLLIQMTKENESRSAVLSRETKDRLLDYLGFRHFFRHAYSFHLEWEEMEDLVKSSREIWIKFKAEILAFMRSFHHFSLDIFPEGRGVFILFRLKMDVGQVQNCYFTHMLTF